MRPAFETSINSSGAERLDFGQRQPSREPSAFVAARVSKLSAFPSFLPSELCARPSGDVKTPLCITGNNGAGSAADRARIVINFSLNPERKWWGKCPSSPSPCARSPLAVEVSRACLPRTDRRKGGRRNDHLLSGSISELIVSHVSIPSKCVPTPTRSAFSAFAMRRRADSLSFY